MSIHLLYTESRDVRDGAEAGFTYPRRHSVTSIGTALLYTKSRTRGVDQFTSSNQKWKQKKKERGKKKHQFTRSNISKNKIRKKKKVYIYKVLYKVDKTAQKSL